MCCAYLCKYMYMYVKISMKARERQLSWLMKIWYSVSSIKSNFILSAERLVHSSKAIVLAKLQGSAIYAKFFAGSRCD